MTATFPGSINALPDMVQDSDGSHTETFTIPSTSPYTHRLATASPYNYGTGYQVVPPSGIANVVTLSGGGNATWTEVPLGNSLTKGTFSVDYSASPTGGTLYFSSADAGATNVTATWTASTLVNETLVEGLILACRSVLVAIGANNGLAGLDANGHVAQQVSTGVRQVKGVQVTSDLTLLTSMNAPDLTNVANWSDWLSGLNVSITTSGGTLRLCLTMSASCSTLNNPTVAFGMRYSGASSGFLNIAYVQSNSTSNVRGGIVIEAEGFLSLAAGTYTFTPIWIAPSNGATAAASCEPSTRPTTDRASFSVTEYN